MSLLWCLSYGVFPMMSFLCLSYVFPISFLCLSYVFSMMSNLCLSYDVFPIVSFVWCLSYDVYPMSFLCLFYVFPMSFLWFPPPTFSSYVFPTYFLLCLNYVFSMVSFLCLSHGVFPMEPSYDVFITSFLRLSYGAPLPHSLPMPSLRLS